jgi:hypothetical protein
MAYSSSSQGRKPAVRNNAANFRRPVRSCPRTVEGGNSKIWPISVESNSQ